MKNQLKIINILNKSYKKTILIVLGFLMALIILEIVMQAAGFSMLYYRDYKNNKALKNKSKYTVMCLGESTTYGGYPKELQNMLNQKYPGKFTIIDLGSPGLHLEDILRMSDSNITKYKPNFAICMIGINDGFTSVDNNALYVENNKYAYLKLYKLYKLIKKHTFSLLKIKEVYADDANESVKRDAYEFYLQKKYPDAAKSCKKIIEITPHDYDLCSFLAMMYYYHLNKKDAAYKIALDIIEKNRNILFENKQIMYEIVIDYNLYKKKNIEFVEKIVKELVDTDNDVISMRMFCYIKDIITPEQKAKLLKKISSLKQDIDKYYGFLAIESSDKKDYKKAEEYFRTAEELRLKYPNKQTYGLYKLIIKKLTDNNIKVICMQYPVRSIEPLKQMLKNEQYYGRIEFLSNEENFKNMLKEKQFFEIFSDQFAGDFGHYKQEGGTLIAENLVESLSKLVQ